MGHKENRIGEHIFTVLTGGLHRPGQDVLGAKLDGIERCLSRASFTRGLLRELIVSLIRGRMDTVDHRRHS